MITNDEGNLVDLVEVYVLKSMNLKIEETLQGNFNTQNSTPEDWHILFLQTFKLLILETTNRSHYNKTKISNEPLAQSVC